MIRVGLAILFLLSSLVANASRVVEVEDYFSKKTTDFVKMRYPNRPFTVQVKVQSGESIDRRQKVADEKSVVNLPYLEFSGEDGEDIWSQPDIPLGTLISYVKSISVNVEIDASFSGSEKEDFKGQLFKYLKLSSAYDQVDVRKMDWVKNPQARKSRWMMAAAIGLPLFLALFLLVLSRLGIRQLVKGLSEPLAAISKNTESMASPSMAPAALSSSFDKVSSTSGPSVVGAQPSAQKFQEIFNRNVDLFQHPRGEFMSFLESWGEKSPEAMGALFAELEPQCVMNLIRWGSGEWWHTAVTRPSSINQESMEILLAMNSLRLRSSLSGAKVVPSPAEIELELVLSRLSVKQLGQALQGCSLEEVKPFLRLVPREVMINCAKYMYPGQWAALLDGNQERGSMTSELRDKVFKAAKDAVPLWDEKKIEEMFMEADLLRYLDQANTSDEREVYRVLPENSRLRDQRFPFFKVFQVDSKILEKLAFDLPLQAWALALSDCDVEERRHVYNSFSDRQIYSVKSLIASMENSEIPEEDKARAKMLIRTSCQRLGAAMTSQNGVSDNVKAA